MIKPEDLKKMTPAQRRALSKAEVNARLKNQTPKPKFKKPVQAPRKNNSNPIVRKINDFLRQTPNTSTGKKKPGRSTPGVKVPGKPVPLATPRPRTYPGGIKPAPMPKRVPNLSLPPDQRTKAKPMPSGPKVKTPTPAKPKPKAKKPTLDDFLLKGKRPPIKLKPGLKRPPGL
jgi:hypothetical protein